MYANWDEFLKDANTILMKKKDFKFKRFRSTTFDDYVSENDILNENLK